MCPDMAGNSANFACPGGWPMPCDYHPHLAACDVKSG